MLKRFSITLITLILLAAIARAQLATAYVDATNGSDSFSGVNPTNSPSGTGPKATIHGGLDVLADNGRLIIFAGIYAGDGVDTDGSPANTTDNADINISTAKYPRLLSGLTIELRGNQGNNEIKILADENTVRAPNGALITHTSDQYIPNLIINIPGGIVTFASTNGTEFLSLPAQNSSGSTTAGLTLSAGSLDLPSGSMLHLRSGATLSINGHAQLLHEAPQKGDDLSIAYSGGESFTAGVEASYGSFGSGVLTINKDAGSSITFSSPMNFSGNNDAVRIQSGSATFNGAVSLGRAGSPIELPRTADLVVTTSGTVRFNAPVSLFVLGGTSDDTTISGIDNAGNGILDFEQKVTWSASYNSTDVTYLASESNSLVWNAGTGSVTFAAGASFTHALQSVNGASITINAGFENNGAGTIYFAAPIEVIQRKDPVSGSIQQFSVAGINNSNGSLTISGTLQSGLTNSPSPAAGGTITINGPTTLGAPGSSIGALSNAQGKTVALGSNTLTLSGNVHHLMHGSTITATTGGLLVNAQGNTDFDGGDFPSLTIQQPSGDTTTLTGSSTISSLTLTSGSMIVQSPATVGGDLRVISGVLQTQSSVTVRGSLSVETGSLEVSSPLTVDGAFGLGSGTCSLGATTTIGSTLTMNGGELTLSDAQGLTLEAGDFIQRGGNVTLGGSAGGDFRLHGDFTRTGGSFAAGSASIVRFEGSGPQSIDPGTSLQLSSLDNENVSGSLRVLQSLRLSRGLTIGAGCSLDLGNSVILLNGDGAVFSNGGSYSATGSGIVFGGATSVDGGLPISNSEIHASSGATFSSLVVDIGAPNTCGFKSTGNTTWSGSLALLSGGLDLRSATDFGPAGPQAKLVRDVVSSKGITRSVGTFNAANVHHSLRCLGTLPSDYTLAPDILADLPSVDSLVFDVNGDAQDNDGSLNTGQPRYVLLPASFFIFGGSLYVGPRSAIELASNGTPGNALELTGSNVHHSIRGILKTADSGDSLLISGANVTITGAETPTDAAVIGNIGITSATRCTISGIKGVQGNFSSLPRSIVTLSMGSSKDTRKIQGELRLGGTSLTLDGPIEVTGGIRFVSGFLNLGTYDLTVSTTGDFTQEAGAGGYSAAGGYLVMNRDGGTLKIGNTDATGLPNLRILSTTYLGAPGRVTRNLVLGSDSTVGIPSLILGKSGNDLVFTGSTIIMSSKGEGNRSAIISDGTTNGTPGGRLFIGGASVTLIIDHDYSIEELTYNPPAVNGTLTILSANPSPHVLTITDILTHAGGQISLGMNHLALAGTGTSPGRRAYTRSEGTLSATTGEFRFVGNGQQWFSCGPAFNVPNLRIWNAAGVVKSPGSEPMVVSRSLDLSDGLFTCDVGSLVLEDGATIVRRRSRAMLSSPLTLRGSVSVSYLVDSGNGNLVAGIELPFEPAVVNNFTASNPGSLPDSGSVVVGRDLSVKYTLVLGGGQLDMGSSRLTIFSGATVDVSGGLIVSKAGTSGGVVASVYDLIYRKSSIIGPTSLEFPAGTAVSIRKLSVIGSNPAEPTVLSLYANRSVGDLQVDAPGGGIEFGAPGSFVARNLTVRDSLTVLNGGFTNNSGTNAIVNLAGTNRQTITVPSSGLTFPGGASPVHLQLQNPAGFNVRGGNLTFSPGSVLFFGSGVLDAGGNMIILAHTATGQGFDRQSVTGTNVSHIYGTVRQFITGGAGNPFEYPNGRYEFPVGSLSQYRPLVVSFTSAYPALNPGSLDVSFVDSRPTGSAGLPLDLGGGAKITGYPPLHWSFRTSSGSLGVGQLYDLETTVRAPGFTIPSVTDLHFISRPDGTPESSPWNLLGAVAGYGTSSVGVTPAKDTTLVLRVTSAGTSMVGENILTIGSPFNRKPVLNYRIPVAVLPSMVGKSTTFSVSVTDPDGDPLVITWKVEGAIKQVGQDTSFVYTPTQATRILVSAAFSDPFGLADSTVWFFSIDDAADGSPSLPRAFALEQNYPNPFNPSTAITFTVPRRSSVRLAVYSLQGQEVRVLTDRTYESGTYLLRWDGKDDFGRSVASGVYLINMRASTYVETRKMVLLR